MSENVKTFVANLRRAIRNRETVDVGGGLFKPEELQAVVDALEPPPQPEAYNHLFSLGFSVESASKSPDNVTAAELKEGLLSRINDLDGHAEWLEACSYCADTYKTKR